MTHYNHNLVYQNQEYIIGDSFHQQEETGLLEK